MKFIARHLNLIGLLMLTAFGAAAAGLYFQTPSYAPVEKVKASTPVATAATSAKHESGCCAEKPMAAQPQPAACPHLTAKTAKESSCCPKPANP